MKCCCFDTSGYIIVHDCFLLLYFHSGDRCVGGYCRRYSGSTTRKSLFMSSFKHPPIHDLSKKHHLTLYSQALVHQIIHLKNMDLFITIHNLLPNRGRRAFSCMTNNNSICTRFEPESLSSFSHMLCWPRTLLSFTLPRIFTCGVWAAKRVRKVYIVEKGVN